MVGLALLLALPHTADATTRAKVRVYKNCTALNKVYKHGVGYKKGLKDHVKRGGKRVTNYSVSAAVYKANKRLDRDHDGIACEKR